MHRSKYLLPLAAVLLATPFTPLATRTLAAAQVAPTSASDASAPAQDERPLRKILRGLGTRLRAFRAETPLSATQRTQLREVLKSHREEIHARLAEARTAHQLLRTAVAQPVPDASTVNAAATRIGENARQGALLRARLAGEIRPLLTPEQRQRIDAALDETQAQVGAALDKL